MNKVKGLGKLVFFTILVWGCGQKANQGLTINANPTQPVLVVAGAGFTDASGNAISPPYFVVNSLGLTWTGSSNLQILAIELVTTGGGTTGTLSCGGSGTVIAAIFANATVGGAAANIVDVNSNVILPAPPSTGALQYSSGGFACGSVPVTVDITNPFATYNVPIEVVIQAETLDASGNATGRVSAVTNITAH